MTSPDAMPHHQQAWRAHIITLVFVIAVILAFFARDMLHMADQWWNSSTYGHCLFILPLIGWLIWQRKDEVVQVEPRAWAPGLIAVALGAFGWLLGEAAGVSLVRHAALIGMIQASILTILGPAATRSLLFPVFYLVFLIPFGDEIVPAMQTLTAKMTMVLLGLFHIKAHLDGVFITTAAGWFEVAEACAGVKFLVAMAAYSALVANVCFQSWKRRIMFLAFAISAPIFANGIRAFGTIYAAHLTSLEAATGFDHIVYGWIFFAVVITLVMAAAWPFFDRRLDDPWLKAVPVERGTIHAPRLVGFLAVVVLAAPLIWSATIVASGRQALPHAIRLPAVKGWQIVAPPSDGWQPRFDGADHRLFGRYRDQQGHVVDVGLALYGWQGPGRQIIGYGQGTADPHSVWRWSADQGQVRGGKAIRMLGPSQTARSAVTFYVLAGDATSSAMTVKIKTLQTKLFGMDQRAAVVILSSPEPNAQQQMESFMNALGPVDAMATELLDQARGVK